MSEMMFHWEWCGECDFAFIRCPKCGNNCCCGGYGQIEGKECDVCSLSYQYQELAFETNTVPKKEFFKIQPKVRLE